MQLGRQLGPYTLERKLGEGGMGVVYAARHARVGRLYAIKVILPELAARRETLGRFEREARALSALGHPNIVQVHDFAVEADGTAYFVMDQLEGTELSRAIADGPLDPARARRIAMDIAAGLGAAHRLGIVHRDLKPSNVFLVGRGERERAVLLDFGLAKALSRDERLDTLLEGRLTTSGTILGTPLYMSPEQARGESIDLRTDVWSLGVVLYEMLTGRPPFGGTTIATMFAAILGQDPVPPSERMPGLSPALEALTLRCLAKDREARPRDGEEVLAVLEGRGPATPATRIAAARPQSPGPITPATRVTAPSGAQRPSVWAYVLAGLAAAGALLATAVVVLFLTWTRLTGEYVAVGSVRPEPAGPALLAPAPEAPAADPGAAPAVGAAPVDGAAVDPGAATVAQAEPEPQLPIGRLPPEEEPGPHRALRPRTRPAPREPTPPAARPQEPAPAEGESLVGRVPPGMESTPGARELAEAGERMREGDFAGCVRLLSGAPRTHHILSVQMSCANGAHDRAALERTCSELRQRFPQSVYLQTCDTLLGSP